MEDVDISCLDKVIDKVLSSSPFQSQTKKSLSHTEAICKSIENQKYIDHISHPISYPSFFENYMVGNMPCILGKWATKDWPANQQWVSFVNNCTKPDVSAFQKMCPKAKVPVADCA